MNKLYFIKMEIISDSTQYISNIKLFAVSDMSTENCLKNFFLYIQVFIKICKWQDSFE